MITGRPLVRGYLRSRYFMAKPTFGEYILARRKELGMTQHAVAQATGMSKGYISMIENDSMPPTNEPPKVVPEKLEKLADALNLDREDVFGRSWLTEAGLIRVSEYTPVNTIIREAGYDGDALPPSELHDLQEDVTDFVRARIERRRRQTQSG